MKQLFGTHYRGNKCLIRLCKSPSGFGWNSTQRFSLFKNFPLFKNYFPYQPIRKNAVQFPNARCMRVGIGFYIEFQKCPQISNTQWYPKVGVFVSLSKILVQVIRHVFVIEQKSQFNFQIAIANTNVSSEQRRCCVSLKMHLSLVGICFLPKIHFQ